MQDKSNKNKDEKWAKPKRPKMIRDSFTMPDFDYARIKALKSRFLNLGVEIKKSEVLRAGLLLLETQTDAKLKKIAMDVERIKTGRPSVKDKS